MREKVLLLTTAAGVYAAIVTETLSVFHALTPLPILAAWLLFLIFAFTIHYSLSTAHCLEHTPKNNAFCIIPAVVIAFVLLTVLLIVVLCPPNNWDVILYHLPRQVQWAQSASVEHFPTQDYRLTVNPPFAEYLGLHCLIVTGSDRFNAFISWGAFALTLIAVSQVAKQAGADRLGQWFAASAAATIPMAIHEATSGKNDGMVALWLVIAAWWLMKRNAIGFGSAIGLMMLTKGTGAVFATPLVIAWVLRAPFSRASASRFTLVVLVVAGLNAGHLLRNYAAYGSFTGQTFSLDNSRHDLPAFASNVIRNLAMHLAMPNQTLNAKIERLVEQQHSMIGIASNEPATTWGGSQFKLEYAPRLEHATAPAHLILFVISLCVVSRSVPDTSGSYFIVAAFLLFCIAFKWQPWHPRLHLPLLTLASVPIGIMLSKPYWRTISPLIIIGLAWLAMPALISSEYRSLSGSRGLNVFRHDVESLRFHGHDDIRQHAEAIAEIEGNVDLVNHGALPWEYPLTRLLKKAHNRRVGYFYPVKGSPGSPAPDHVIDIGDHPGPEYLRHASGAVYRSTAVHGPFTLYERVDAAPPGAVLNHAIGRFGIGAENPEEVLP